MKEERCLFLGSVPATMPIGILNTLYERLGVFFEYINENDVINVFCPIVIKDKVCLMEAY